METVQCGTGRPISYYQGMNYATAQAMRERYWIDQWTQAQIAEAFGRHENTVSRVINELVWAPTPDQSWADRMPEEGDMRSLRSGRWK